VGVAQGLRVTADAPDRGDRAAELLPFREERHILPVMVLLSLGFVAGGVSLVVSEVRDGAPLASVLPFGLGLAVIGTALAFGIPRLTGVVGKHVGVDADGVTIGGRHLPAEQIGDVRVVPSEMATAYVAQGYVKGDGTRVLRIPTGQSTFAAGSLGRAVLVEQRPDRAWLLASRCPEGLAAAITAARDGRTRR
jgi:hypothetical protein